MELSYDWNCFRSLFLESPQAFESKPAERVLAIVDGDQLLRVFDNGSEVTLSHESLSSLQARVAPRKVSVLEVAKLEKALQKTADLTHFHAQGESLRHEFALGLHHSHFLLQAVESWWAKILPSAYGIFLRISEGASASDSFLLIRGGKVESFHRPDLSWMRPEHSKDPAHVVKYLAEKNLVPVQGVFMSADQWNQWSESSSPWKRIAQAIRSDQSQLVPFRWSVATMLATRAFFKL